MSLNFNDKQKSLKRRFLLIIGIIAFVCFCALGGMVMFWDEFPVDLLPWQRKVFGALIVLYSVLRFSRLLKKDNE